MNVGDYVKLKSSFDDDPPFFGTLLRVESDVWQVKRDDSRSSLHWNPICTWREYRLELISGPPLSPQDMAVAAEYYQSITGEKGNG